MLVIWKRLIFTIGVSEFYFFLKMSLVLASFRTNCEQVLFGGERFFGSKLPKKCHRTKIWVNGYVVAG
jgi:hypothetical protein